MLTVDEWNELPYLTRIVVTGGRRGFFYFVELHEPLVVVSLDESPGTHFRCLLENVMPLDVVERLAELAPG